MRSPVNSLRAELRRTKRQAREARAADLYNLEALRATMTKAAGEGFAQTTIAGPDGLDLRETAAAKAALAWLTEMGLVVRWDARGSPAGSTHDLIVSWRSSDIS